MFTFNEIIHKLIIDCDKAAFYSSKSQYEELSLNEEIKFKAHLAVCKACRLFDTQNKIITKNISQLHDVGINGKSPHLSKEKKLEIDRELKRNLSKDL